MKRAVLSLMINSFRILAVAGLLACNSMEVAASVIIVKSDDIPQYDVPIEAFRMAAPWKTMEINIAGSRDRGTKLIRNAASTEDLEAVFALGAQAAWLSRQLLPDTPLVYAMVLDSNRNMLDGKKTTGVTVEIPVADLLTRFKLIMPELERIGVIYSETSAAAYHDETHEVAAQLGLDLRDEVVLRSDEVAGAYRRLRTEVEALWMIPDPTVVTRDNFSYLAQRCRNDDIAFLAFSENFVRAGALLSISPSYRTMGSQAAVLMEKIVADPDRPPSVQPPLGSSLTVNADTARRLGIRLNATTLNMTDKLIDPASEEN